MIFYSSVHRLFLLFLIVPLPSIAQYEVTIEGKAYQLILARDLAAAIQQAPADTALEYNSIVVQGPLELTGDTLHTALAFEDVRFTNPAVLERAVFLQPVHFVRTHFQQGISLLEARLESEFSCRDCRVVDTANFKRTLLSDKVDLSATQFSGAAFFQQSDFSGETTFERTQFADAAYFDQTVFARSTSFQDASFADLASFKGAAWQSTVSFAGARFGEDALFAQSRFAGAATFTAAYFRSAAHFERADFSATASFRRIVFAGPARFVSAHFRSSAFFIDSRFKQEASFAGATFAQPFRPDAYFSVALDLADVTAPSIDLTKPEAKARSVPLPDTTDPSCNPIQLVDITRAAGLDFEHYNGFSGEYYYVETFGSGAAFLDVDGDGWLDLYLVNGAPLSGERPDPIPTNRLYHNTGAGGFTDVTAASGAGHTGYGMGCAAADYDADGDVDLYVTNVGPNLLLRNEGGGSFADATAAVGGADARWGTSCGFLDYDLDGDLDLYATNYVEFDPQNSIVCAEGGIRSYCEPKFYEPVGDVLYRNENGQFRDVTLETGIIHKGRGLGVAFSDYDLDGDTDVYVANDGTMNFLYQNQGNRFAEVGLYAGGRYNEDGLAEAGMGVEFGDWDNDGLQDIFVTNFAQETNTLYGNEGQGQFYDITQRAGLAEYSYKPLGFGTNFFDYDNDGDLDLFVANGHVMDKITQVHPDHAYPQPNQVLCNQRGTRFVDVSSKLGSALAVAAVSRASATADYDNDGDLDLLVTNVAAAPNLLRNDGGNRQHWLTIQLGNTSQHARVAVTAGGQRQVKEYQSGGSYLASSDPRLHFGLGEATEATVEIRWPDGTLQKIEAVATDQILHIIQSKP
ncbi:MAG: FG-GAP-like repeat-containing protein [Gemmatimonadota bacterium]|nr:FG-GAP-like repeat-containing protein [Gemmatimonadota bacterium]